MDRKSLPGSPVTIGCWNARGYLSATPFIREKLKDLDILAISEHWLHSNRLGTLSGISDTHEVHAHSSRSSDAENFGTKRGQGGVAIFWRKDLGGISKVSDIVHDRICAIRMQTCNGIIFYVLSIYLPSQGSYEDLGACLDDLSEIVESREEGAQVIICGDFNGDMGVLSGPRGRGNPSDRGRLVSDFFQRHCMIAANSQSYAVGALHTFECHNGRSTIDYIAVPEVIGSCIVSCGVEEWHPLNNSDHLLVTVSIAIGQVNLISYPCSSGGRVKWGKLSTAELRETYTDELAPVFSSLLEDLNSNPDDLVIDECFEKLTKAMILLSNGLPKTKFRKNLKPFWNSDLSRCKKEKVAAYRIWVSQGRPRDADNPYRRSYKHANKIFSQKLRTLARSYENSEMVKVVKSAEVDRNSFWNHVRSFRKNSGTRSLAIKGEDGVVVHEIQDVLEVWRKHFSKLGTPKVSPSFDDVHFHAVSDFITDYNGREDCDDIFLQTPFSVEELRVGIKTLNSGKAPGHDGIVAEHLKNAGSFAADTLCVLYNRIREREYIPKCFRIGVRIPLFKGKDLSNLSTDSYRGITLLSTFNKLFEILIWNRLKGWWVNENVVSDLQGACKTGHSCIHSAFILQETIATSLENNNKCIVAFYDVAKAFDSVWIGGLFKQIYDSGITGKTWRLLYRCYVDFKCCVKILDSFSEWYNLACGIHQGGYMSLLKYTVFINSLLTQLKHSQLCCKLYKTPSAPVGYADDLAAACVNKHKMDQVMDIVYSHGRTWRYDFNAKKSGVLVFGETMREHKINSSVRVFRLGTDRVSERTDYDHVGNNVSIFYNDTGGIRERISKARRTFNALTGMGIRKCGLTMATCNLVFWSVVVPVALYGCELWRLNEESFKLLESFQNYACKRIQRFHPRAPNACGLYSLGWVRLERYIQVKKMLFIRSILTMEEGSVAKTIFSERVKQLNQAGTPLKDEEYSIVSNLMNVVSVFNLSREVLNMIERGHVYEKATWKKIIWDRAWSLEDTFWRVECNLQRNLDLISVINPSPRYLTWWALSDRYPSLIYFCETLGRLVCHASLLRMDDIRLKGLPAFARACPLCDLSAPDDARHLILQCTSSEDSRNLMFAEITARMEAGNPHFSLTGDILSILLGKQCEGYSFEQMECLWVISGKYIHEMYRENLRQKEGIG